MFTPPPAPLPRGIRFGTRLFTEPSLFPPLLIPRTPGLYAILVSDRGCSPRPFRVLYFGESGDLHQRLNSQHEKFFDWVRRAAGANLYYAYHVLFGPDQVRRDAECELINTYTPICNERVNTLPALRSLIKR